MGYYLTHCARCGVRLTGKAKKWCPTCRPAPISAAAARTTTERGYNYAHRKERERWKPTIAAGRGWCHAVKCLMPSRYIPPGAAWHLGHTLDRTSWTGPEHPRCNTVEGARRGGLIIAARGGNKQHHRRRSKGTGWNGADRQPIAARTTTPTRTTAAPAPIEWHSRTW